MKKIKEYLPLHLLIFMYSICSVFSKLASNEKFLSGPFILYYGISILILGVYAILWQQILKKFQLNVAFISKSVSIIWGMLLGLLIFNEQIKITMIIGCVIVLIGVITVVSSNE